MLRTIKGVAKRFAIVGIAALCLVTMSTVVQANCLAYLGTSEDGTKQLYLTCGSSAGAGFWECPVGGGPCEGFESPSADFLCATGLLGCGGDGLVAKLMFGRCDAVPNAPESKPGKARPASGNTVNVVSKSR